MKKKIYSILKLMRIKHYLKNLLIFFPLIFSGNLFQVNSLVNTIIGFLTFSMACSIVYILNDIKDKEKDMLHEKKKHRPIASGKVTIKEACIIMVVLLLLVVFGLCILQNLYATIFLVAYLGINVLYSYKLKEIPILDVSILAIGFLIRVLYGASIIEVEVSNWLYLTVMSMSFYLSMGKRRNELVKTKDTTRKVLNKYNKEFLDKNMNICLTLTLVFYSLWTVDMNSMYTGSNFLILTVPFVLIICMKYSMAIESDSDGDPIEVVYNDKILLVLIAIYCFLLMGIIYFFK